MAGGEGARLRPLTIARPKPLVPIVNKSVMGHILDLLRHHGFTDVVVTLRFMASAIEDSFDDGSHYGLNISYCIEESPLGTAGSVKNAAHLLGGDEPFLVISGDALTDFDLQAIVAAHKERGAPATITLTRVTNPSEYGVVVCTEEGMIERFLEKPGWSDIVSDTVNTGIYVIEPEVLDLIPDNTPFDFSNDLFPTMLKAGMPMYGHVADGYWCDVGTIEEYMRANADVLYGRIKLSTPIGAHLGGGVYVGRDVDIAPNAQLYGPVYLGNEVKIKDGVRIYGPSVVRDYSVVDNHTLIERSVIWRNNYIGESCEVRGATIVRECSLKPKVLVFEGAVIGDHCVIGEGSVIHADVKLWPRKEIEPGTVVKDSIIWGNQGRRSLFGRFGVSGVVNVELTPEFAAKLGAAIGATLPKGSYVAINRDEHRSSRMLKRALISGLPGTGVNVVDLGTVAIPTLRHFVRSQGDSSAGIHVRLSPFDQRVVDIRVMDSDGANLSTTSERAIERNFFREDFRRAYLDDIGQIAYAHQPAGAYMEDFLSRVDVERIREADFRVVVDYSNGLAADTLSRIFISLGVDVVALNSRMAESKLAVLQEEFHTNQERMGVIVHALGSSLGIQVDVGGEKIFVVDENGDLLDDATLAALMVELALYANPGRPVAVPVTLPNSFDTIGAWHNSTVHRIGQNQHSLMTAANQPNMLLVADGQGNFAFPDFMPAVDGLMATVRLLELLAIRRMPVSEVLRYLPPMQMARASVPCTWEQKGVTMRRMHEHYKGSRVDNIDGIKVHLQDGAWVHISPHYDQPAMMVVVEAASETQAQEIAQQTVELLQKTLADEAVPA
jgi:mannose-1-phosphate guanylyltransferase/phosphomannomutase